jgi:hypothetical protein
MREENAPGRAEPIVKTHMAFRRIGLEVWGDVAELQSHVNLRLFALKRPQGLPLLIL